MQMNRLFEIIYLLLNKENVTARKLAERFQVSTRTIYRDIDTLSLAGIPVYTERGKGGGISLLPDFVLNKSILSEQEQNEVISALQGLTSLKTDETDRVLKKLSTIFNKTSPPWLDVDFTDWSNSQGSIFHDLKIAILERRVIEFDYYSTYGEKTFRRAEPLQLWFKSTSWYVKAYCLEKQSLRIFKLKRIRDQKLTDESFTERNLLATDADDEPSQYKRPDVYIKLKIAPEMTYRVFDDFFDAEKQQDGSHIISVTWPEDDWVYGFILSFGEYIEVLEPEHIRKIIREKSKKISKMHL